MKLMMIVAKDKNNVIGNNNELPWYLPEDLKYFKNTTTGFPIIMGRNTFESIGFPLPKRENIILTRNENYEANGCTIINSIDELMLREDTGFVIGGSEIFKQFMPVVEKIFITRIEEEFEGDSFFPEIGNEWEIISSVKGLKDEKNPFDYFFEVYTRKN